MASGTWNGIREDRCIDVCGDATLRTSPSSGQATIISMHCDPSSLPATQGQRWKDANSLIRMAPGPNL
jgi:hypothetical protein